MAPWLLNGIVALPFLLLCLMSGQHLSAAQDQFRRRIGRADHPSTAIPVACQLSEWSAWTECFPCLGKKYRHRNLVQPSKFEGTMCGGDLWDEAACTSPEACIKQTQCGHDFQCKESGRCIKRRLLCNGDRDCNDASDEEDCEDAGILKNDCLEFNPIPGSEMAAQGFNILTHEEKMNVYDPTYFGGWCERIYNGDWKSLRYDAVCENLDYDEKYFRRPYNFIKYQFETQAQYDFHSHFYSHVEELTTGIHKEEFSSTKLSIGIPIYSVILGLGFSWASGKGSLKNLTQYTSKEYGFIRTYTKAQTAHFRMRRDDIVLDEDILQAIAELPDQYDYGMYSKFINDYGTHYITSGAMGGIAEFILVIDKEVMRAKKVTDEAISSCFGASLGIQYKIVQGQLMGAKCKKDGAGSFDESLKGMGVRDIISRVRGGILGPNSGLSNSWTAETYLSWGRSLKDNPAVIDFELLPIFAIFRQSNLGHHERKWQNMRRALDEYLTEHDSCRCGPCLNNGEPILKGTTCQCQCPEGRSGFACERMEQQGSPAAGHWNCWSSWSACQAGIKERSRSCSNPAPQNGGASCQGASTERLEC
ncbi:complement component C8 alpha chain isoform X1 [Dromiciops gliroides]|uniref:complement component C8 alpha chain isoform X1 n=1 Tax=Dromiciops gliroides TaxID=33562 RepID=UPI001CC72C5D|nr:complement component C8 alpha chain isoform X1 [Dromiciops gliroides]XP_043861207.1 complement component C8 alpha chain isoform X1 [Dromiciops gliroides]XP_043861208.1 complement component C8 alpha chain isoform X1 [Dromiciops gliroides]